jgi:molybdopterin/thiamine biosynthesis adenylyltransferase
MNSSNIKIIGIGGIGTALLPFLCRYLNYNGPKALGRGVRLTLVDGDNFEGKNAERQDFAVMGNKARVKAEELARVFPQLSLRAVAKYITPPNAAEIIEEGDIIFLCVDNHATRKLVSEYCQKLKDVLLISGGNDLVDGNVQIYWRGGGKDLTQPLTRFHPEIATPKDKSPHELSCEELMAQAAPQLLFTNLAIASAMLNAFYGYLEGKLNYSEVYIDILEGKNNPVKR